MKIVDEVREIIAAAKPANANRAAASLEVRHSGHITIRIEGNRPRQDVRPARQTRVDELLAKLESSPKSGRKLSSVISPSRRRPSSDGFQSQGWPVLGGRDGRWPSKAKALHCGRRRRSACAATRANSA